jgi:hypothetical protein
MGLSTLKSLDSVQPHTIKKGVLSLILLFLTTCWKGGVREKEDHLILLVSLARVILKFLLLDLKKSFPEHG